MDKQTYDYVILGAGLSGISLATKLKKSNKTVLLEKSDEPGGLVKSIEINGFWFDAVLHLLHYHNPKVEKQLKKIVGSVFKSIAPRADVHTSHGVTKFPFQLNVGGLPKELAIECVHDYIENAYKKPKKVNNFEDWLIQSFGQKMCEVFFFPYNNKMWKRSLKSLGTRDFVWNIQNYSIPKVLNGLFKEDKKIEAYNANSWYPVPRKGAKKRCMGLLIDKLKAPIDQQIHLEEEVIEVDSKKRCVTTRSAKGIQQYYYKKGCISTIPLPVLQKVTIPKQKKSKLKLNGVLYAMIMCKGKSYDTANLWDYFSDEGVIFSRIIYMQNFDPHSAPKGKWSFMAEITYKAEAKPLDHKKTATKIKKNLLDLNIVKQKKDFIDIEFVDHKYAYAVFEKSTSQEVRKVTKGYAAKDIHLLGRYGKWQYQSMAQVFEEALAKGDELNKG